jgi:hypothetical protein
VTAIHEAFDLIASSPSADGDTVFVEAGLYDQEVAITLASGNVTIMYSNSPLLFISLL